MDEPSTHDRLRAFEDKHFVDDKHPRHGDRIERGIGSKWARDEHAPHRAHHAALEALIAAEDEHKRTSAAADAAHAKLVAAIDLAVKTQEAI